MKPADSGIKGAPLRVQIHNKEQSELEQRVRGVLVGRKVTAVFMMDGYTEIFVDSGESLTFYGDFHEVS